MEESRETRIKSQMKTRGTRWKGYDDCDRVFDDDDTGADVSDETRECSGEAVLVGAVSRSHRRGVAQQISSPASARTVGRAAGMGQTR